MSRNKILSKSHTIRFPLDLYDRIHILADKNSRTFNGQVIYLLQIGFAVDQKYIEGIQKTVDESQPEQ